MNSLCGLFIGTISGVSDAVPSCHRLLGVPRVSAYSGGPRPPEDDPWPACIQAWLEFNRDDLGLKTAADEDGHWHNLHVHVVALTGSAFCMGWSRRGWDMAACSYLEIVPDPLRRLEDALALMGRPARTWWREDLASRHGARPDPDWSGDAVRERITRCIGLRGQPIIAVGLMGLPEPCLVTGYEDDGRVLYGWSLYSEHGVHEGLASLEPSGEFRMEDWLPRCQGLLEPGDRTSSPDWKSLDRAILRQGLEILSCPKIGGLSTSIAASTQWAETLLDDALFADLSEEDARRCHACHWISAGTAAERRAWGSWHFHSASERNPEVEGLYLDLAECFDKIHDLVWAVWQFTGSYPMSAEGDRKLSSHGIRGRIVPLLRLIRDEDARTRGLIQQILDAWGCPAGQDIALPGAPPLGYSVRLNPLMACLEAFADMVEDPVDYDDLMAVSGAAFRRVWNPVDGGNVDIQLLHPEPIHRAAKAMARDFRTAPGDRDQALRLMRKSLLEGRPAIAFGIAGPPEACLVTGVSGSGASITAQTWFSERTSPIEVEGWFETRDPHAPVLVLAMGDRQRWHSPDPRSMVRPTLEYAVELARSPSCASLPDHLLGLAALRAWRAALAEGSDYESSDESALSIRGMVHGDQVTMTAERTCASTWLARAASLEPSASEPLLRASSLYARIAEKSHRLFPFPFQPFAEVGRDLAKPGVRVPIVDALDEIILLEEEAVGHLEEALALLGAASKAGAGQP